MITKESLRIGNWILASGSLTKGAIHQVTGIDANMVYSHNVALSYSNVEGISLSSEWLKKCGFVIGNGPADGFYVATNGIAIQRTGNDWWVCLRGRKGYQFIRPVNFVHELQNLHYFLIDKEIEIKAS